MSTANPLWGAPRIRGELLKSVKPHKVRHYLDRRAPAFAERKAEVIEVYAATIRSLFDSPLSRQK